MPVIHKKLVSLQKKITNVSAIHLQPKRWSLLAEDVINKEKYDGFTQTLR